VTITSLLIAQGSAQADTAQSMTAPRPSENISDSQPNPKDDVTPFDEPGCPSGGCEFATDHVIVKLAPHVDVSALNRQNAWTESAALNKTLSTQGALELKSVFPDARSPGPGAFPSTSDLTRWYRVHLDGQADVSAVLEALSASPDIEYAEPDYLAHAAETSPDDPLLPQQWGLDKIQALAAWDTVTGTETIVIAVLDSGIALDHPDLASKLWVNPAEIAGNGIDEDSNGFVDDVNGWDFVNDDNDPSDDNGHGTQVTGIIAADTDNEQGIAGVCWNCRVMPVKVMQVSGIANYSDIASGVYYAADKGAEVINISLGGYANSSALRQAIEYAVGEKGAVVVAGAGNDNTNDPFYPAAYAEVLAVAGTDTNDAKAAFSDYGDWVDVSAPAVTITTTYLGGDWGPAQGTSFAAPFAAGLASLLRSQHPTWSEALVRAQIVHRADPIDTLNPAYAGQLGSGRLNANAAVNQPPHPILELTQIQVDGKVDGRPAPGKDSTLQVTLSNTWLKASAVTGTLTTTDPHVTLGQATTNFGDIAAGATSTGSPLFTFTVASSAGYNHVIPFTLAILANENTYSATLPLTISTRSADEPFCGTVAQDMVWTNDKTYIIECDVGVAPGYTLTIQPGTTVRFNGMYDLNVGGTLIADGTAAQPIRFVSNTGSSWGELHFDDSSLDTKMDTNYGYLGGSILRHVQIQDTTGLTLDNATPYISHISVIGGVGIEWTPGDVEWGTAFLPGFASLTDSTIWADTAPCGVLINGHARYLRNQVTGNSRVEINGQATVIQNKGVGVQSGTGSYVYNNTVDTLRVTGTGTVVSNSLLGDLNVGNNSLVMSNTLKAGGIVAGGGSHVLGNSIQGAGWGLQSSGQITATANRLVGNQVGIKVRGGKIQGNLVADSQGAGLELSGNATVISNTFTHNRGTTIRLLSGTDFQVKGNNLEGNIGPYDIDNQISKTTLMMVMAQGNWWGTTSSAQINQRIFDYYNDYTKGQVLYAPAATGPIQTAPAYIRAITLTPESPVGIEQVTFNIEFSRQMDTAINPALTFHTSQKDTWETFHTANSNLSNNNITAITIDTAQNVWLSTWGGGLNVRRPDGTWENYTTANSDLASDYVHTIAADTAGNVWISVDPAYFGGVSVLRADGVWETYTTNNSDLSSDAVYAILVDAEGNTWFGTEDGGVSVLRSNGTWQTFNTTNSGLASNSVNAIAIDAAGNPWFGTNGNGVSVLRSNGEWQTFDTLNSMLTHDRIRAIAIDTEDTKWFGTNGYGVSALSIDGNWRSYDTANSQLAGNCVQAIAVDAEGNKWFGTIDYGVSVLRLDDTWKTCNASNSGLTDLDVQAIAIDVQGNKWFGTEEGLSVLWGGTEYVVVENNQWHSPNHYQATYDINALIPRDTYSVTIKNAVGTDGIKIAHNNNTTFTVDYAGAIGDTTPPHTPIVLACGADSPDTLSAQWTADDPDSVITRYRYAIGTIGGGTDIVNWTETQETDFVRTSLNLVTGETYYVSVQARNAGGLWSEPGISSGIVAGSGTCPNANFTATPTSGPASLNVQFTDTSSGTVESWLWDFGDNLTSTLQNPLHIYNDSGIYTVSLQTSGPGGGDRLVKPNYISVTEVISAPQADFTASPRTGNVPLEVHFSSIVTGTVTAYQWRFGDGATAYTAKPTHTYESAGTFGVTLVVTGAGRTATVSKPDHITVNAPPGAPTATFSADTVSGTVPLTVTFTAVTSGTVESWHWHLGDGTQAFTGPTIQHTYHTTGTFDVRLTVSNTNGSYTDSKLDYIHVNSGEPEPQSKPQADFSAAPRRGAVPLTVTFTSIVAGTVTEYTWTFGDGDVAQTVNPSHIYTTPGHYTVSLRVNGPGGYDTETKAAYISVGEHAVYLPITLRTGQ